MPRTELNAEQLAELRALTLRNHAAALLLQCRLRDAGLEAEAAAELANAERLQRLAEHLGSIDLVAAPI